MLRHFELVHRLAADAELGGKRGECFDRMPGPGSFRQAIQNHEHFGTCDMCLISPVESLGPLGLLRRRWNVHRCEIPSTAHARPTDEAHERRALFLHGCTGDFSQPRPVVVLAGRLGQKLDPREVGQQVNAPGHFAAAPIAIADRSFEVG